MGDFNPDIANRRAWAYGSVAILLALAFPGTGFFDGYHAVVTTPSFAERFSSVPESPIPWSRTASRLFLALMLWLAIRAWRSLDISARAPASREVRALGATVSRLPDHQVEADVKVTACQIGEKGPREAPPAGAGEGS